MRKRVSWWKRGDRAKEWGERRWCERTGSKTQKNNVACHGAESTPKIHSPALLSRVQGCLNIAMHDSSQRLQVDMQRKEKKGTRLQTTYWFFISVKFLVCWKFKFHSSKIRSKLRGVSISFEIDTMFVTLGKCYWMYVTIKYVVNYIISLLIYNLTTKLEFFYKNIYCAMNYCILEIMQLRKKWNLLSYILFTFNCYTNIAMSIKYWNISWYSSTKIYNTTISIHYKYV